MNKKLIAIGLAILILGITTFIIGNAGQGITIGWLIIILGILLIAIGIFYKPLKKLRHYLEE